MWLMFNVIEYSDNYLKTSGSLCYYYKDDANDDFSNSKPFNFEANITGQAPDNDNKKRC